MSLYLGIDQSYDGFGMAALESESGMADVVTLHFPARKFGSGVDRLWVIHEALSAHLDAWLGNAPIEHVCMEGYSIGSQHSRAHAAGELGAIVKLTLLGRLPIPACYPTIVPPSTLKKYVTGKGSSPKDVMIKEVYRKWGRDLNDNNAADAYGLSKLAQAIVDGAELEYEKAAIAKLTPHTEKLE